jgi:hypothetical protein
MFVCINFDASHTFEKEKKFHDDDLLMLSNYIVSCDRVTFIHELKMLG